MRIVLACILLITSVSVKAGHLIGGEISYYHVGGDTYAITLRMYRDCYAGANSVQQFDSVAYISIYEGQTLNLLEVVKLHRPPDSTRLPLIVDVPCLPDPPDLCVLEMVYTDTILITVPSTGVHIVNQRCCRTPNAINVLNPGSFGSTYTSFIPGSDITLDNSSPTYNQIPPIALCVGIDLELDYSATDVDGDSLYYDFCTPLHGAGSGGGNGIPFPDTPAAPPFTKIPWSTGFNNTYQIPSSPAFSIDHATGIISGRPSQIGTYAFGVCVRDYRDDVLLSENRRDFQMEATVCEVGAAAAIDSALEECIGLEIEFFNLSTLGNEFWWDFGDPTTIHDTSTSLTASYTYPDTGVYHIMLVAIGDAGCTDTSLFEYYVRPKIEPQFKVPDPQCFDRQRYDFVHKGVSRTTTDISWILESDTIVMVPDQTGIYGHGFSSTGYHEVTLLYEDFGCVKTKTDTILVHENPVVRINEPPQASCPPLIRPFSPSTEFAGNPHYVWLLDNVVMSDSTKFLVDTYDIGAHTLSIIMFTDSLCVDTVRVDYPEHVEVLQPPTAILTATPMSANMFEREFTLIDSSLFAHKRAIYLGTELLTHAQEYTIVLPDTGNYIFIERISHNNGCVDSTSISVRVEPEFLVYIPNSFTPNADGYNDVWLPNIFVWSDFNLHITDRWGRIVFTSRTPELGWTGIRYSNQKECPMGIYYYDMKVESPSGQSFFYNGTITLTR